MIGPDSEVADAWIGVADASAAGQRLDQWLATALGDPFSRTRVQGLIRDGHVEVSGAAVTEPKRKLAGGEWIAVEMPDLVPAEPLGEAIPLVILWEDDSLIVIDKPAGLVVHPGAGNWTGTLVNALIHHCGDSLSGIGGVRRPGIVHRLDKDTSGVMVIAKSDAAHRSLSEAFGDHGRAGDLERAYLALVWGAPSRQVGTIDAALGRSGKDRTRQAVVRETQADARRAVTHFKVVRRYGARRDATAVAALVDCRLETGRTHQIRVHMAHIGHPVIGDPDYGQAFRSRANRLSEPARSLAGSFPRQALHAWLLGFRHPGTGAPMRFEAPPPPDLATLMAAFDVLDP